MGTLNFATTAQISLGDMGLAIDYLLDKDAFEPEVTKAKNITVSNTSVIKEVKKTEVIKKANTIIDKVHTPVIQKPVVVKEVIKNTTEINPVVEVVKQVHAIKPVNKTIEVVVENNTARYDETNIDVLYSEVKKFLKAAGVEKTIVDRKLLDDKFGERNVKKLILKSYLIAIGRGVTIGKC